MGTELGLGVLDLLSQPRQQEVQEFRDEFGSQQAVLVGTARDGLLELVVCPEDRRDGVARDF